MTPPKIQRTLEYNARKKLQTNKIMDRLTYSPVKHKQRKVKELRQRLQKKPSIHEPRITTPPIKTKFGSFNVNGLNLEACWAVQELLEKRGFDVSQFYNNLNKTTLNS